jgi:hypothetical protein
MVRHGMSGMVLVIDKQELPNARIWSIQIRKDNPVMQGRVVKKSIRKIGSGGDRSFEFRVSSFEFQTQVSGLKSQVSRYP